MIGREAEMVAMLSILRRNQSVYETADVRANQGTNYDFMHILWAWVWAHLNSRLANVLFSFSLDVCVIIYKYEFHIQYDF